VVLLQIQSEVANTKQYGNYESGSRVDIPDASGGVSALGSSRVRFLAHSKGGLDSMTLISDIASLESGEIWLRKRSGFRMMGKEHGRDYFYKNFEGSLSRQIQVESYLSINSPHGGSPLSDLALEIRKKFAEKTSANKFGWWKAGIGSNILNNFAGDFQCELELKRTIEDSGRLRKDSILAIPIAHISTVLDHNEVKYNPQLNIQREVVGAKVNIKTNLGPSDYDKATEIRDISTIPLFPSPVTIIMNKNETVVPRWSHSMLNTLYKEHFKMVTNLPNQEHTDAAKGTRLSSELIPRLLGSVDSWNWRLKP
jgi:hypothetical protein